MTDSTTHDLDGTRGRLGVRSWRNPGATYVVALAHGLGEHTGRYEHVAAHLVADGAEVRGPDHWAHGLSDGEPGLVDDLEGIVTDFDRVVDELVASHPDVPLVVLGHSMGGIVATRWVQRNAGRADALVLSGPVVGGNDALLGLLALEELPDVPIDPAALSRDPAVGEAYAADELVYHGPLRRGTLIGISDAVDAISVGGDLGDLPTLWIHGEHDSLAPLPETTRAFDTLAGSALQQKVYAGAMHEIFNETNQDEVLADVTDFLHGLGIGAREMRGWVDVDADAAADPSVRSRLLDLALANHAELPPR